MERSSTSTRANPRKPISIARVTTRDGRRTTVIQNPLNAPPAIPIRRQRARGRRHGDALLDQPAEGAGGQPHHRRDRQVDLSVEDDEGHDEDDDHLLDGEDEQVDLIAHGQEGRRGEGVHRHDAEQQPGQESFPGLEAGADRRRHAGESAAAHELRLRFMSRLSTATETRISRPSRGVAQELAHLQGADQAVLQQVDQDRSQHGAQHAARAAEDVDGRPPPPRPPT